MRRTLVVALSLLSVLLLGATFVSYSKYRKSVADHARATAEGEDTRLHYERAVGEIVAIQDSLNAIVLGEDAVRLEPARREVESPAAETLHDRVLSRVATLRAAIERTRDRVEELDARLKKSGVRISGLERMVDGLRESVTEKEERIAQLSGQVDTLQTRVAGLSTEVEDQNRELTEQQLRITATQRELATIFYAMGTKKELIRSGVVVAEGGVLGFGKTLKPSGNFPETAFVPVNTDQENVIRIPFRKARVLSPQPAASYELRPSGQDALELRILDAREFRKIKHLVIVAA
jgi:predicted RNase H-like nuclease (RuvC/YqgF family)